MSDPQAALREKFRGVLAGRALRLADLVRPASEKHRDSPERRDLLGELHTLKGEAKMLGWARLATLVHALEERLGSDVPDIEEAAAVVDAILLSFSDGTSDEQAEALWLTAIEALADEALEPAADDGAFAVGSEEGLLAAEAQGPGVAAGSEGKKRWLQVEADTVDALGETLATFSTDFARFTTRTQNMDAAQGSLVAREIEGEADRLRSALSNILLLSLELRLTPVQPVFARLAAHARMLAKQTGKVLDVVVRSSGARVEREIIERLSEPLLHLVSNAVDHGIEPPSERGQKPPRATLELSAESQGALVVLKIRDDGRGIDRARVLKKAVNEGRLAQHAEPAEVLDVLFQSGFSTRDHVDEVSGRGVGLDVVKRQTEAMGVRLTVESELGAGTTFALGVPAALTQENLLVIGVHEALYAIPGHLVHSVLHDEALSDAANTLRFQDETLPLRSLAETLGFARTRDERRLVVVQIRGKRFALRCQQVLGHFELIRRPAGPHLRHASGVCASAQTDHGELVLVLDESQLRTRLQRVASQPQFAPEPNLPLRRRVLVVDDSVVVRNLLEGMLASSGFSPRTAENGLIALRHIEEFQPGLVLSDIEMPVMGGFELLRQIRERYPLLPVVLVTARSSEEDQRKAVDLGANAYVTKGEFASESLVAIVERLYREKS